MRKVRADVSSDKFWKKLNRFRQYDVVGLLSCVSDHIMVYDRGETAETNEDAIWLLLGKNCSCHQ